MTFYDRKGGAWWNAFNNLKRHLSSDIQFDLIEIYHPFDTAKYDFFYLPEEYLVRLAWFIPSSKIISGSCCSTLCEKAILAHARGDFRASIYNSLEMYEKAKHLPNVFLGQRGVDTNFFAPSKEIPQEFTACWVGNSRSVGEKGLDIIKQACNLAHIPLRYLDSSILSQPMRQEEIRDTIYHRSSVYICASKWEGTPNPALEALSCGLPVISTPVGNMPEILINGVNGLIVERSPEAIADALRRLKKADLHSLRCNARISICNGWTWKHQAAKYEHAFKALAQANAFVQGRDSLFPGDCGKVLTSLAIEAFMQGDMKKAAKCLAWRFRYSGFCRLLRKEKHRMSSIILRFNG